MTMEMRKIVTQLTIQTERFDLRPLQVSDMGLIELYAGDKRVATMTSSIPHPLPPGTTEAFVNRCIAHERDEDVWVIDGTKSDGSEVMGLISLTRMDRKQSEVAYWVAPAYWNTGLASEAVQTLVEANPMENDTMFGAVFQDNPASAKVLTHCGFEYLGDAETFSVARDNTIPTWTYTRKLNHTNSK
jgi:RimJ/RimL family protein N-acetyltransferase